MTLRTQKCKIQVEEVSAGGTQPAAHGLEPAPPPTAPPAVIIEEPVSLQKGGAQERERAQESGGGGGGRGGGERVVGSEDPELSIGTGGRKGRELAGAGTEDDVFIEAEAEAEPVGK